MIEINVAFQKFVKYLENKFKEIKLIKKIYNNYMKKNINIIYKNE